MGKKDLKYYRNIDFYCQENKIPLIDMKYYDYFMKADLSKYIGEWIAIVNNKVVSHNVSVKKTYEEAKKKYPKKRPLLARVPNKETMIL